MFLKASTAMAGRSGGLAAAGIGAAGATLATSTQSPMKRNPLRGMVRITRWALPSSCTALRAALIHQFVVGHVAVALFDQEQQQVENLGLHGHGDAVARQFPQLALEFVIFKAKSQRPAPLLKQNSWISQAKHNPPEKPATAHCGMVQPSISKTIVVMEQAMSQVHTIGPDF